MGAAIHRKNSFHPAGPFSEKKRVDRLCMISWKLFIIDVVLMERKQAQKLKIGIE